MAKVITVRGAGDDHKVVLWERDPAHPKGEVFVVNDGTEYQVAETKAVKRLIGQERLVKVEAAPKAPKAPADKGKDPDAKGGQNEPPKA